MTRLSPAWFGVINAVVAGLGATLGAGVFVGVAPAAAGAGGWLWLATVLAALLALCGAPSVDDLARACPGGGGAYRYARHYLGRLPGRMAGGVYIVGRIATLAALARCFGDYVVPVRPALAAVGLLVVLTIVEAVGARLSRASTAVLVVVVLTTLALVFAACVAIPPPLPTGVPSPAARGFADPAASLAAAGTMFFAFLGFERLTVTEGGSMPRLGARRLAIPIVLMVALVCYLSVGAAVSRQLGPARLALSRTPLRDAVVVADAAPLTSLVTFGAIAATLGVLLSVLSGARQTVAAMSSTGDLPVPGRLVPAPVWVGAGGVVAALVLPSDMAIGLAATCALISYGFVHASARLLPRTERAWPARTACLGLILCLLVTAAMPVADLLVAGGAMAVGAVLGPLAARLGLIVRR